ncbi:restriction endonuclease subunit S [Ottowia sp.]|uniref:restriction endonuclease subunit S n=1 Tax=Ottowia sp. TaxID=1898956 RepID=UPI0039E6095B
MTAESVPLNAVATVIRGVTFDKTEAVDAPQDGYLPILRAGNIADQLLLEHDLVWVPETRVAIEQRMRPDDIAICMSSGSQSVVGKTAPLLHEWNGSVGAFCAILRPKTAHILPAYLSYFLKSEVFRSWTRQSTGANIKNIRKTELESFPVPLVSLEKQRRIVDLLSRAEGIVRLRREAQAKAQAIIPALFLDMFGDPATNPEGWPVLPLGKLLRNGPTNGLYKHKSAYGSGTPILRIDAFYDGKVRDLTQLKRVALDGETERDRFALAPGDIVINRVNSPEYLGKSALIPALEEATVYESNMMRFAIDTQQVLPEFVIALLQQPASRQHFLAYAKHAINQSSINQQDVKSLPVIVPPVDGQTRFKEHVTSLEAVMRRQAEMLKKAEVTFHALLLHTFGWSMLDAK